jgi:translation initiation factor IF-3
VPVPRKFDRRPPERDQTRINDRIRVPEVRLIGDDGKQIGVVKTSEALVYAQERDLDLVEVAPDARPPVVRVLDYSKYRYEQAQKQKAARRHQQQITVREIKFRPKIAQNDYDTKKGHVARFLRNRDKVKITIMFRGREVTHPERGTALLDRLAGELSEIAVVEQAPVQDGRNMTMLLAPSRSVLAGEKDGRHEKAADGRREKESDGRGAPAAPPEGSEPEGEGQPTSPDGPADQGAPEDRVPAEGAPEDRVPAEGAPEDRVPAEGAPEDRVPAGGAPEDRVPAGGAPEDRVPAEGAPEDRVPADVGSRAGRRDAAA